MNFNGAGRRWTKKEDSSIKSWWGRKSLTEIATLLGRTQTAVGLRANRTLLLKNPKRGPLNNPLYWTKEEDSALRTAYSSASSWAGILEAVPGRSRIACQTRAGKLRLKVDGFRPKRVVWKETVVIGGREYGWCLTNKGQPGSDAIYVALNRPRHEGQHKRNLLMHRVVYEASFGVIPPNKDVHHINGDTLDNRPENLEMANRGQHQRRDRQARDRLTRFVIESGLMNEYRAWSLSHPHEEPETVSERLKRTGEAVVLGPNGIVLRAPYPAPRRKKA